MVDDFYMRVLNDTDYAALAAAHEAFEDAMRGATVRVTTPAGTDISFGIGDRPVTKQDGNASAARARMGRNLIDREVELPAGAIRVAPIEESVIGTIVFPPSVWGGERAENLTLRFERGVMVSLEASVGPHCFARDRGGGRCGQGIPRVRARLQPPARDPELRRAVDSVLWLRCRRCAALARDNTELGEPWEVGTCAGTSSWTRRSPSTTKPGSRTVAWCVDPPNLGPTWLIPRSEGARHPQTLKRRAVALTSRTFLRRSTAFSSCSMRESTGRATRCSRAHGARRGATSTRA